MILAAEDIGLADPQALVLASAAAQSVALVGMPEGRIALSEVTIYLALAPKSNTAYNAINSALADVRAGVLSEVPNTCAVQTTQELKVMAMGLAMTTPTITIRQWSSRIMSAPKSLRNAITCQKLLVPRSQK